MILCTTHHEGCPCREAAHRETEAQRDQMAAALQSIATYTTPGIATPFSIAAAHRKAREALGDPLLREEG